MKQLGFTDDQVEASQLFQNALSLSPVLEQSLAQGIGANPYTGQKMTTLGERAQSAADTVYPSQILTDLWSKRFNPTEEALKNTIGVSRPRPPVPPQVLKQTLRQQAKTAGQKPVDEFITWLGGELSQMGIKP